MTLTELSHDDLATQATGRATILATIVGSLGREAIPAPVMDDLTDWAREPVMELVARADELLARYRGVWHHTDPVPDDLADKSIAAMREALEHDGFDHCLSCQAVYQTKQASA